MDYRVVTTAISFVDGSDAAERLFENRRAVDFQTDTTDACRFLGVTNLKTFITSVFIFCLCQAAHAASFDCAKAASKSEKQICATPELSKLDEELASSYENAKNQLSPASQKLFVNGQRAWLKFHSSYCFYDQFAKPADKASSRECQIKEYKSRIESIRKTGTQIYELKIFPYFQGTFHANPKAEWRNISFDRREVFLFDGSSALATSLNAIIKPRATVETDNTESTNETNISLEQWSPDLILIRKTYDMSGGAHPVSGTNVNYFSKNLQRLVKVGDVFNSPQWKTLAQKTALQHFKKQGIEVNGNAEIYAESKDPFNYPVTSSGFTIDGFLSQAERAVDGVDLSWKAFGKHLTPLGQELSRGKVR